jgi:hypothetical protein
MKNAPGLPWTMNLLAMSHVAWIASMNCHSQFFWWDKVSNILPRLILNYDPPPISTCHVVGIRGVSHCDWPSWDSFLNGLYFCPQAGRAHIYRGRATSTLDTFQNLHCPSLLKNAWIIFAAFLSKKMAIWFLWNNFLLDGI